MKTPHKQFVVIGSLLLIVAVITPIVFVLNTFFGHLSYRAVAVVLVHPFNMTAFDRAVRTATNYAPHISVEPYRSTSFSLVAAVADTPQIAAQRADAAAARMLASLAEESGDGSTFHEHAQLPFKPYRPRFRTALAVTIANSAAFALAGIALLVVGLGGRQR